jgi:hypothetical protein
MRVGEQNRLNHEEREGDEEKPGTDIGMGTAEGKT